MGNQALEDSMVSDGLIDKFNDYHMGITAENLVEKYGISREEQDQFAAQSQQKAAHAKLVDLTLKLYRLRYLSVKAILSLFRKMKVFDKVQQQIS